MVMVTLVQPLLVDPADGTSTALPLLFSERSFADDLPGEVQRMANGALRPVTRPGRQRQVSLRVGLEPAQFTRLGTMMGRTILYRDGLGTRLWCVFFALPSGQLLPGSTMRTVNLTLLEVSRTEAV